MEMYKSENCTFSDNDIVKIIKLSGKVLQFISEVYDFQNQQHCRSLGSTAIKNVHNIAILRYT